MDYDLLHMVADKNNYLRFKPYIREHLLTREANVILNSIDSYYTAYPKETVIKWEEFETYFFGLKGGKLRKEEAEIFKTLIERIKTGAPSAKMEDLLEHYIQTDYAAKIADKAISIADGDDTVSLSDIGTLVESASRELGRALNKSSLFVPTDISSIAASVAAGGLEWRLEEMNVSLGPLRTGDFILVGAFVETGKTTFVADQVSYMATQIVSNRPVIWVNNEERSNKVMFRIVQATLGWTAARILSDTAAAMAAYTSVMGGNKDKIQIISEESGISTVRQLDSLFKEFNPALIVFDQLDKVSGYETEDRDDIRLGKLWGWGRRLAHEYGPVIAISQADATANGQKWIYEHQLRGSKVDKPGELDAIITIGRTHEKSEEFKRFINVPKNKLFGGPRTLEKERHGMWEVTIKPELARYEGNL